MANAKPRIAFAANHLVHGKVSVSDKRTTAINEKRGALHASSHTSV